MNSVIGMDLGDKKHVAVVMDGEGKEIEKRTISNTPVSMKNFFSRHEGATVVMEAGTHSPWISRLSQSLGHETYVGNPRKLRTIWDADDKSDERDARILAMIFRLEPRFLHPIKHRGVQSQADLCVIKARSKLVECRTGLVNHVRCIVKGMGERLPSCSTAYFAKRMKSEVPESLRPALDPVIEVIEKISIQIDQYDKAILIMCTTVYPETQYLQKVAGVGSVTALAFVLTLEDASRFEKSRSVGAFLGLVPRRDQSGKIDKQLSITKAGNTYLRTLLVGCAQYIMGPFGPESDLRRYGLRIAARGGKNAKKRAAVAVARKLAVLLHRLWADRATYIQNYAPKKGVA